jgi:hypothetical protein
MGMQQAAVFPSGRVPSWPAVRDLLAAQGFPAQMRMIDQQLAFPDEMPPEQWSELRLGTPQGMVTIRRQGDRLIFVTWGNADAAMQQAWNAVTWAFAEAGGGQVETDAGVVDAAAFRRQADLPPVLQGPGPSTWAD